MKAIETKRWASGLLAANVVVMGRVFSDPGLVAYLQGVRRAHSSGQLFLLLHAAAAYAM